MAINFQSKIESFKCIWSWLIAKCLREWKMSKSTEIGQKINLHEWGAFILFERIWCVSIGEIEFFFLVLRCFHCTERAEHAAAADLHLNEYVSVRFKTKQKMKCEIVRYRHWCYFNTTIQQKKIMQISCYLKIEISTALAIAMRNENIFSSRCTVNFSISIILYIIQCHSLWSACQTHEIASAHAHTSHCYSIYYYHHWW